jgi:hypothetical protein
MMTVNDLIQLCEKEGVSLDTPIFYVEVDGNRIFPTIYIMSKNNLTEEELNDMGEEETKELPYICVGD